MQQIVCIILINCEQYVIHMYTYKYLISNIRKIHIVVNNTFFCR